MNSRPGGVGAAKTRLVRLLNYWCLLCLGTVADVRPAHRTAGGAAGRGTGDRASPARSLVPPRRVRYRVILMVYCSLRLYLAGTVESVTVMVTWYVPGVHGRPLSTPVSPFSRSPDGREPCVTCQV